MLKNHTPPLAGIRERGIATGVMRSRQVSYGRDRCRHSSKKLCFLMSGGRGNSTKQLLQGAPIIPDQFWGPKKFRPKSHRKVTKKVTKKSPKSHRKVSEKSPKSLRKVTEKSPKSHRNYRSGAGALRELGRGNKNPCTPRHRLRGERPCTRPRGDLPPQVFLPGPC